MTGVSLNREEKQRILKAIEEDREFRYALMGLLGFSEILERITKLEEGQQRLAERFAELEERFAKLEERFARLEERVTKLEERFAELEERVIKLEERLAKLEERVTKLEERFARLEERFAELEERQQKLEERVAKLEERLETLNRTVIVIAHRFGILSESGFREGMKYVIEDILGVAEVDKWVYYDEEGMVYGFPSIVEVDLVIKDSQHILIEVKSRVSRGDVLELHRIGKLYEKVNNVKPKLLIIGGFIDKMARKIAQKMGVEIKPILEAPESNYII